MKKTLQRELRVPSSSLDSDAESSVAVLSPSSSKTVTAKQNNSREDDINFKYLKHVLIKFLTSREYEVSFFKSFDYKNNFLLFYYRIVKFNFTMLNQLKKINE